MTDNVAEIATGNVIKLQISNKTGNVLYVYRDLEARSRSDCYRGKQHV